MRVINGSGSISLNLQDGDPPVILFLILMIFVVLFSTIFVLVDGLRRGMNPLAVLILCAGPLVLWIVFFPLYLIVRPPQKPNFIYVVNGPPGNPQQCYTFPNLPPPLPTSPPPKPLYDILLPYLPKSNLGIFIMVLIIVIIMSILAYKNTWDPLVV